MDNYRANTDIIPIEHHQVQSVATFICVCWQVAPDLVALGTTTGGTWRPIGCHLSAIASR
ncbi:MAG: hypothetical protein ACOYJG_01905 [Prevotella sp.]